MTEQNSRKPQGYARRAWKVFKRDARTWAEEHIWWDILFLIAPPAVMLALYGLKPDYRVLLVTLGVYVAVLVIYCLVQLVQIPAKLDDERARELAQREVEVTTLKSAVSRAEQSSIGPFLALLRERQRLEDELQPLLEIEEAGIQVVPAIKIGKDESDYRREKIEHLRRDIAAVNAQIDSLSRAPSLSLAAEWKELAGRFAKTSQFLRAHWQHGGMGKTGNQATETWRFAGDLSGERDFEPLCRLAGKMLLRSSKALAKTSKQTQAEEDDVRRWLYFLKDRGAMTMRDGYAIVEESREAILFGSINDVANASKNACLYCAAEES